MKKNLISISTIKDKLYEVMFHDGHALMYPKGSNITLTKVIGVFHGRLYRFMFSPTKALISITNNSDLCEFWHRSIVHLHHWGSERIERLLQGYHISTHSTKMCALGNYTKVAFPSSDSQVEGILDLIQSNMCGHMSSISLRR